MTYTARRTLLYVVIVALAGAVLCVAFAAIASADDCTGPQCCAREPSGAAEPAPLPHLYLPLVQHLPRMSAESTPARPIATPEPEVELPLGDAGKNN